MEVQFGPNPTDEPNLQYKLQRKIKVFNTNSNLPNRGYNLVACASKYGIVFIATPEGTLSVYYLKQLIDRECENPPHLSIQLQESPTHIAVSCDQESLAITGGQLLVVFKNVNFQNQNVSPSVMMKLNVQSPISSLQWNPCVPDTIAIAYFSGALLVSLIDSQQIKKIQAKARCVCWSPKGKQLVVGNSDGSLTQYKPDLTATKTVPPPNLYEGVPVEAVSIYWISTYQFAVVYKNATDNSRPTVTIINTPKGGQPSCVNYEDVCYSMGSNRPWYYYLQGLPQWNIIMASSSNSMEIATLGSTDGANWSQWSQSDEARPELPLTDKKQENYPVGICIDTCAIYQLPWGENSTLPYMPLVHVVSQSGLLVIFNVINLNNQQQPLCTPPQPLSLPTPAMTESIPGIQPQAEEAPAPKQPAKSEPTPVPFGLSSQPQTASVPTVSVAFQQKPPPVYGQIGTAPLPKITEESERPDTKPVSQITVSAPAKQPSVQPVTPTSQPVSTTAVTPPTQELNASLKAEQERANIAKANQELKKVLIFEVCDFQMELYNFVQKSSENIKQMQKEINAVDIGLKFHQLDTEQLRKECSLDEIRAAIVQFKLDTVRTLAVVAEAQTHAEATVEQWSQPDPLTTKRLSSVKKLAYYVQNQLEQAHRALDYKWDDFDNKELDNKPGQRMIRPFLDSVYQPLVKQQEILSRQQALLKSLRNTMKECNSTPLTKSTSLLRSTPFKNGDPLSKLTKNILNMSIEPQSNSSSIGCLTPQKLDALRERLSNHKTVKVKPVNIELREHLAAMRLSYQKSVKEKAESASLQSKTNSSVKIEGKEEKPSQVITFGGFNTPQASQPAQPRISQTPISKPIQPPISQPIQPPISQPIQPPISQPIQPPISQPIQPPFSQPFQPQFSQPQLPISQPIQTPIIKPEPKKEIPKSVTFTPTLSTKANVTGLNNVARTLFADPKPAPVVEQPAPSDLKPKVQMSADNSILKSFLQNDHNTFMGQNISSPSAFSATKSNSKSAETGEPESSNVVTIFESKTDKKPTKSLPQIDILKTNTQQQKVEKVQEKPEKSKENIPTVTIKLRHDEHKELRLPPLTKSSVFGAQLNLAAAAEASAAAAAAPISKQELQRSLNFKIEPIFEENEKPDVISTPSSVFGTGDAPAEKKEVIIMKPSPVQQPISAPSQLTSANVASEENSRNDESTKQEEPASPLNDSSSLLFATANAAAEDVKRKEESSKPEEPASPLNDSASLLFATANAAAEVSPKTEESSSTFPLSSSSSNTDLSKSSVFVSSSVTSVFGVSTQSSISTEQSIPTPAVETSGIETSGLSPAVEVPNTAQSVFAAASAKSGFTTPPASPKSVFATTPTTQGSIFNKPSSGSIFGSPSQSVFGTPATQASVFGSPSSPTQQSIFGGSSTFGTPASVFGTPSSATASSPSVFASVTSQSAFATPTATTQSSVFGKSVFGSSNTQSVFGGQSTSPASVFGSQSASPASVFGGQATTQASVFGGQPSSQTSVFGTPPSTQTSVFGSSPSTQASVFGSSPSTQTSVFGSQPATTAPSSGSLFGSAESNMFASASISTTSASGGQAGNIFGGSGSSTNVFGSKSTFGQSNPSTASIFGGGGATSFGQNSTTNLWGNNNASTGSAFGQPAFGQQSPQSSVFGASPSGGGFGSSVFGGNENNSFGGSPQQTGSAFGGSAVFGSKPAFGQSATFGSGGFGQSGFGVNKSPGGFGAPAAFGSTSSGFGAPPTFGSSSPVKAFGGTSPGGFGAPTQSNSTFENLANQNTLTFGNLAQQSGQQPAAAPTFNTSPSFSGWRG